MGQREIWKKASKKYYEKNKDRVRKHKALYARQYRRRLRHMALETLGGICVKCGVTDWRALQIDHIHGGGNIEMKKFNSTPDFCKHIIANPDKTKYQILCANCNKIKSYENKEWGGYKYEES